VKGGFAQPVTRRAFQRALAGGLSAAAAGAAGALRIGIGAYTYHNLPVEAMIEQLRALHVTEIEMSRGEFMNFNHPPLEMFQSFRRKIDAAGVRCVSYYAPTIRQESDVDAAIVFARALGCNHISGDPVGPILKYVDERLTAERLTFGIHNHYFKGRKFDYESPEDILRSLEGLSATVGCTLDLGHIVSCGFDTLDAVRKLGPRLKLIHLKDIQASGGEVNVMLGSGKCRIPEVMRELRRIGFQGLVALEYEKDGDINDEVRQQLAFARRLAGG
jgi:sugar phosphate isomerase/epimerase